MPRPFDEAVFRQLMALTAIDENLDYCISFFKTPEAQHDNADDYRISFSGNAETKYLFEAFWGAKDDIPLAFHEQNCSYQEFSTCEEMIPIFPFSKIYGYQLEMSDFAIGSR